MEDEYKVVCALSNSAVFDDLVWPRTPVSISRKRCIRSTPSVVLGKGFRGRRIEWRYFRFDNIQDGGWPPSWNSRHLRMTALSRVTIASAGLSCREIVHIHSLAKFQVCSFTRFGDIFEGVQNVIGVTWPRPRPFSEILFVHFGEIVHMHPRAKFQVCSFTGFGDMFESVPSFIRVTWCGPPPLAKICSCTVLVWQYWAICQISSACYCLARSAMYVPYALFSSTCLGQKLYCACAVSRDLRVGGQK